MNDGEQEYKNMIDSFRYSELYLLLRTFNRDRSGRKYDLKNRALSLLNNKPADLDYPAYLNKISEIYHSILQKMQAAQDSRTILCRQPQQTLPRSIPISQTSSPQIRHQIQRGIHRTDQANHLSRSNQRVVGHYIIYQPLLLLMNPVVMTRTNTYIASNQSVITIRIKKSPFHEIIADIIKPTILSNQNRCSTPNSPEGIY